MGIQLSGRAFDCRSRGPWFKPGCPLEFQHKSEFPHFLLKQQQSFIMRRKEGKLTLSISPTASRTSFSNIFHPFHTKLDNSTDYLFNFRNILHSSARKSIIVSQNVFHSQQENSCSNQCVHLIPDKLSTLVVRKSFIQIGLRFLGNGGPRKSETGIQLSGRAFDCRSRGPWFKPGCPLSFSKILVTSIMTSAYPSSDICITNHRIIGIQIVSSHGSFLIVWVNATLYAIGTHLPRQTPLENDAQRQQRSQHSNFKHAATDVVNSFSS